MLDHDRLKAYNEGKQVKLHWLRANGLRPQSAENMKQWKEQGPWELCALHAWLERDGLLKKEDRKNG